MEGKEVYGRGILREIGGLIFGGSWICREEWIFGVGLDQYKHRVAGGFGHGGPGYPYDILELGSFPSWHGG
jgi:hypothetical protein